MAIPLQYQSQFIPTDFGAVGQLTNLYARDMANRDQLFDQSFMAGQEAINKIAEMTTADPEMRNKLMEDLSKRIEETVTKKGGDYGAAAKDITRIIAKERSNPWYQFDTAKLQSMQDYNRMQNQLGINFYSANDPSKVTLDQYLSDPTALQFQALNKEDLRKKMADIGKAAANLYTEDINRQVAQGVQEIGSATGYRTPQLRQAYMEREGQQAINDLMTAYGIDPNNNEIRGELEQELLANIGGEKKTQFIYPRTGEITSSRGKKTPSFDYSKSQPMENIQGTLPVKHPTWNLQGRSQGAVATGQMGKNSPYINSKLTGAYIPKGEVFRIGAGEEIKGGKAGAPVQGLAFAPGSATYTGAMTIWRIQDVEQNTPLTKEMQERIGNAAFIGTEGGSSRKSIPGVGMKEKPIKDPKTGRYYYIAKDGDKKTKVYVEETPVLSFSVVDKDGKGYTAFETIGNDRDRVLGEFGTNAPIQKPIDFSYKKQGDSYIFDNIRPIDDYERLDVITQELVSKIDEVASIGTPQAITKANELTNGLSLIQSIQENLSQGRPFIATKEEKDILENMKDYYLEIESALYGKRFELNDKVTPDIQ